VTYTQILLNQVAADGTIITVSQQARAQLVANTVDFAVRYLSTFFLSLWMHNNNKSADQYRRVIIYQRLKN
jgi:hypothetical protein